MASDEGDQLLSNLASADADEDRLLQIAKLAETGLSVAAVVHDVRQPLAALKMAVQLARDNSASRAEVETYLRDALEQTARLEEMLERTRDFLGPGEAPTSVDVSEVANTVAVMMQWQLARQAVRLDVDLADDLPAIEIQRAHLEQLIFNLLQNARDAAAGADGRVLLLVRGGGPERVELIVADNGAGIDKRLRSRIFEPFFTTKARECGTGLGLYIVKRIAERHGGGVELMDASALEQLGRGPLTTGFRIEFAAPQRDTRRPAAVLRDQAVAQPRRALVVDDEEVIRRLVGRLLEGQGFECAVAASGEAGLQLLEEQDFALLVTDKNLPGISGIELVRFARTWDPAMPIIVITGYASEDSAVESAALGVADYVLKPIDVHDFRERVRRVMGDASARQEALPVAGAAAPTRAPPRRVARAEQARHAARAAAQDGAPRTDELARLKLARSKMAPAVAVLLVEPDEQRRETMADTLGALGCRVVACATGEQALRSARQVGFEVLIAGPPVLREYRLELAEAAGARALGSIAIMDRAGVDKAIEAIHLGARGVIAPPFEPGKITFEFKRSVERLIEEKR